MLAQFDITQLDVALTMHWTEAFAAWLYEHDRRPNTISAYLQDVRHFAMFFERENDQVFAPGLMNATDIKKYFARQDADKDVAVSSRNRRLASLKVLVEWAVAIGAIEYDPTVCIKRQSLGQVIPRDRSQAEMGRLNLIVADGSYLRCESDGHAWLGQRDRVIWLVMTGAGLRIHEAAGLDVDDLDFDANKIFVIGKGGKKADVDVSMEFMNEIAAWLQLRPASAGKALITDQDGNRITTGQIRRRIQLIGAAAGVKDLKPHDLRHTYAYLLSDALMKMGLPMLSAMNGVRKQLRHGDLKTTTLYFGVRESQIRAAVEVM